jgi:hypothetical protein
MNKTEAENLIFQIQLACPNLDYGGTYSPSELRLTLTPNPDEKTRIKILEIVAKFGQEMKQEDGLVIIYEPR